MIKYHDYRLELSNKKLANFYRYKDLAEMTGYSKQNIQQILTGKQMGSHESYKALERILKPSKTFTEYVQQFKPILEGLNLTVGFVAEVIGMSKLGLDNIIECRNVGQLENYMKLEEVIEKWENS